MLPVLPYRFSVPVLGRAISQIIPRGISFQVFMAQIGNLILCTRNHKATLSGILQHSLYSTLHCWGSEKNRDQRIVTDWRTVLAYYHSSRCWRQLTHKKTRIYLASQFWRVRSKWPGNPLPLGLSWGAVSIYQEPSGAGTLSLRQEIRKWAVNQGDPGCVPRPPGTNHGMPSSILMAQDQAGFWQDGPDLTSE